MIVCLHTILVMRILKTWQRLHLANHRQEPRQHLSTCISDQVPGIGFSYTLGWFTKLMRCLVHVCFFIFGHCKGYYVFFKIEHDCIDFFILKIILNPVQMLPVSHAKKHQGFN